METLNSLKYPSDETLEINVRAGCKALIKDCDLHGTTWTNQEYKNAHARLFVSFPYLFQSIVKGQFKTYEELDEKILKTFFK